MTTPLERYARAISLARPLLVNAPFDLPAPADEQAVEECAKWLMQNAYKQPYVGRVSWKLLAERVLSVLSGRAGGEGAK